MSNYIEIVKQAYIDYANYLLYSISHPSWNNFFYWVLGVSLFFFVLEIVKPWRENQSILRKDFWLDLFYILFNFFLFPLLFWKAGESLIRAFYGDVLSLIGAPGFVLFDIGTLPKWVYFLILFVVADFLSWCIHRMLHRVPFMWEWHKVHHSVEEMGFAAHVRYHWMENVIYWIFRFIPLSLIGYDLVDIFAVHIFNMTWGHFNHANISIPSKVSAAAVGLFLGIGLWVELQPTAVMGLVYVISAMIVASLILGPFMKKLFNSPEMHIWHHAYDLPNKTGVNFGITLAIWDYLFGTVYWPTDGKSIKLGFPTVENFPTSFIGQSTHGFIKDDTSSQQS